MDSSETNRLLIDRIQEVCSYLLPNGVIKGNEYLVGGIDGDAGKSLQVTISGPRTGMFKDFASPDDKGGTPLWLWKKARGVSFATAVKEAKEWLGVKDEDFGIHRSHQKTYSRPESATTRPLDTNTKVMDYLTLERRLDPIIVAKARIRETKDGEAIAFPFYETDPETGKEECVHVKHLKLARTNGKKESWASTGTKRCLYGKQLVSNDVSDIVITEGEIDSLSYFSVGIPAVSIPNGVSDFSWVEIDWEWLARFERIYVSTDMDEPGRTCAQEICKRLGLHRCYIVELPKKDANDCLLSGLGRDDFLKCLDCAKQVELDEIKRPDDYRGEVMDYYTTDWTKRGWDTPWWPNLPWRVRKSEFSVLSGFSGSGKALSLDTPIPTPRGWTTMGDVKVGDIVFDENGKPCNVILATDVQLNRECFRVEFSDGSNVVCDAEHLWKTWSCHARNSLARKEKNELRGDYHATQIEKSIQPEILNTRQIKDSIVETRWCDKQHLKHSVPVCGALQIDDVPTPIDPYCLGAWLGDGATYSSTMFCGNGDELIINQFEKSGYGITRHNLGRKGSCQSYSINGMTKDLREAGVLGHKHIPNWYLRSSRNQRLALLQGLMDTDGFCGDSGTCEFCSMLPELADNVLELVISLGIRATLRTGQASVNGKKCGTKYRVMFTTSLPVFRLERKLNKRKTDIPSSRRRWRYIKSVSPVESVPVKCIGVDSDSHMFLCSKWMIPTHNTAALNQLALHLIGQGVKIMDISLEVKPGLTLYNMTRCAMAKRNGTKPEIDSCISWINESMYFLDCIGTVGVTRLMHAMEYARKRHGVDVFIIDSLFKCGLSSEDYGGQREFADKLTTFVNNTGAHVILVAHSRKVSTGNELSIPSKSDVAGSSDITNAAFNVIIWWRNKLKKRKLDELRSAGDTSSEVFVKWLAESDGKAVLDKQRFGEGEEAEVNVWFDKDSTQFHTVQDSRYPYFQKK